MFQTSAEDTEPNKSHNLSEGPVATYILPLRVGYSPPAICPLSLQCSRNDAMNTTQLSYCVSVRDDSRCLQTGASERSVIILSDMNGQISEIHHLISPKWYKSSPPTRQDQRLDSLFIHRKHLPRIWRVIRDIGQESVLISDHFGAQ